MYLNNIGKYQAALIMAKSINNKKQSPFLELKKQFQISDCYKNLKQYEKAENILLQLKKQYPSFSELIDIKIQRIYDYE
jgi:tetratricopeptide (TPR) repeat protein